MILCFFATSSSWAIDVGGLCASDVEGTYSGRAGPFNVQINVFCVDKDRMMATICPVVTPDGRVSIDAEINLSYTTIDGDQLILSNFMTGNEDRHSGSSKTTLSYARVDLDSFLKGQFKGFYVSGNMSQYFQLNASRTQRYPKITTVASLNLSSRSVYGVFSITSGSMWSGAHLLFDVLSGTPVVSLVDSKSDSAIHFTDGPLWDGSGLLSIATPEGNGGEPDDKKLFYIRGHFLDADHLDFYLISPAKGLEGPLRAERTQSRL